MKIICAIALLIISTGVCAAPIEKVSDPEHKVTAIQEKVHVLMNELYLTTPSERARIHEKIVSLGDAVVPTLIEYLKQNVDPFHEINASDCLVKVGEAAVPLLIQDLISQVHVGTLNERDVGRVAGVIVKIGRAGIPHIEKHRHFGNPTVEGLMEGLIIAIESF